MVGEMRWRVDVTTMHDFTSYLSLYITLIDTYKDSNYTFSASTIQTYIQYKMNSLNALGNRQISSLQADLSKMENGESGPSVQGQSSLRPSSSSGSYVC